MPQLSSGRHVALSAERALAAAREGNFTLSVGFTVSVRGPDDMAPLIDLIYYAKGHGTPEPAEPYLTGLTMCDIGTERCDWSAEEIASFEEWLATPRAKGWLRERYEELAELIRTVKAPLPESLRGIFD